MSDTIKYVAALSLLVGVVMTTPAMQTAFFYAASTQGFVAAAAEAQTISPAITANAASNVSSAAPVVAEDSAVACPAGFTCVPNPKLSVSSVVVNGPNPTVVSYRFNIAGVDRIQLSLSANGSYASIPGFSAKVHQSAGVWSSGQPTAQSALGDTSIVTRGHTIAEWIVDFSNNTGKDVLVGLKAIGYSGGKQVGADADALTIFAKPATSTCPFGYTCTANPASPTLSSVSPIKITLGANTPMTMTGTGFNTTLMIGITGPDADTSVKPSSISVDGTSMTFTLPSSITAPGSYAIYPYNYGKQPYGTLYVLASAPIVNAATGTLSLDPSTPLAGKTDQATNTPVLVFDLKSPGTPARLANLVVNFNEPLASSRANAYLYAGDRLLGSAPISNGVARFTNTGFSLPADATVAFIVKIDAGLASSGQFSVVAQVNANGVTLLQGASGNTVLPIAGSVVGNPITFILASASPSVSNLATTYGSSVASTNGTASQAFMFSYNITAGNDPVYVSTTETQAVAATTTSGSIKVVPVSVVANPSSPADASSYFFIAPGATRSFTAYYQATGSGTSSPTFYQASGLSYTVGSANNVPTIYSGSEVAATLKAILFH